MLTKWELTKWEVDKVGIDEVKLTKWELTKWELTKWEDTARVKVQWLGSLGCIASGLTPSCVDGSW